MAELIPQPSTHIEIDLGALAANISTLKRHVGPQVELIAVVKANAYGHGASAIARGSLAHGATRLAVARVEEGVALRQAGIAAPVLVMGYTPPHEIAPALAHDLTLSVTERDVAEEISREATRQGRRALVHVKVDTGMGRFGLLPDEALPFVAWLRALPSIEVEGIFSHFAAADSNDLTYTREQLARFSAVIEALQHAGHTVPLRHIANSVATIDLPATHLNTVRCGIAIYGLRPAAEVAPALPLQPVLSLKSYLARVRTLRTGESISYGRTYITPRQMPVGLVPVGYGDGYHRLNSNRGAVLVNGQRAPILGRVTMDQFVVDLSAVGPVSRHDEVVLIGAQGDECISAEEVAQWSETINYEVTTSLLPRIPRIYLNG
ncbi:MAG: alanine racemase [Chloroflexi bacterium]|nr:alanine racemase [Chloroflexota bacterium]